MKSKLLKVTGLLFVCFSLFISCTTPIAEPDNRKVEEKKEEVKKEDEETKEEEKKKESAKINFITKNVDYNIQELAAALGVVNRIIDPEGNEVTGTGSVNRSAARLMNGEELYYTYPNTLYFYAYLVEYNDFTNSDVLNWMETNEFNSVTDCSFHQGYSGITIDPQKKYVEVCSDIDANNKVIYCSIRIHYPKNNQEVDGSGKLYGIDCGFDPTFTIDRNVGKNIKTKEDAIYVYGDGWNEGENPWTGKKFRFVKYEWVHNGVLKESNTAGDEDSEMHFNDDVIICKEGNESFTIRYFWNAKYKLLYMLGTGGGCPRRFELNGNQLKSIWGVKFNSYNGEQWTTVEDYQYSYYELIE